MKKAIIIWTTLSILLIMLITGCQATTPQTSVETYTNAKFGFSFEYPEDWKVRDDSNSHVTTITLYKPEATYVTILAWEGSPLAENFRSLEDFYERGVMATYLVDAEEIKLEVLGEHNIKVSGLQAKEATFTYNYRVAPYPTFKKTIVAFLDTRNSKAPWDSSVIKIIYEMPIDRYDDYYRNLRLIVDTFKFTR